MALLRRPRKNGTLTFTREVENLGVAASWPLQVIANHIFG